MFTHNHYVPILKWKPAEIKALEKVDAVQKKYITPLIQLVLPNPSNPKKNEKEKNPREKYQESLEKFKKLAPQIPKQIITYWGSSPIFVDLNLIIEDSLKLESFDVIVDASSKNDTKLIPVLYLNMDEELKKRIVAGSMKMGFGICLRLFRSDFENSQELQSKINDLLVNHSLSEDKIDIVVDFQITDYKCNEFSKQTANIPSINKWRSFTFCSGAFPKDLSKYKLGHTDTDRLDWRYWNSIVSDPDIKRKPAFGDYTIQHPIYVHKIQNFPASASIKYTTEESWFILRGEQKKNEQYLANANILFHRKEFKGEKYSYGDEYIAEKAKDMKSPHTGNAPTWLAATINHHLVLTANQIANLS